jgi:tetratricopeptide (TPR) repeat protein
MDPDAKRQLQSPSDDAIRRCEQSLALYRQVDDPWEVSEVLLLLALLNRNRGAIDQTIQFAEEGLAIAREIGHGRLMAFHLLELGAAANLRGQFERAERLTREMLDRFRKIGSRFDVSFGLACLGCLLHDQGRFAESRLASEEGAQLLDDLGRRQDSMMGTDLWLGAAEMHLGLHEQAQEHLESYLSMVAAADSSLGLGLVHLHLAEIAMVEGAHSQAQTLLRECLTELRNRPLLLCEVLSALACNALKMGQRAQARRYVVEALVIASDPDHLEIKPPVLRLTAVALLLCDEGQMERAVELWALASRHPFVHNSQWFHEIAGREIVAAAEALPPEVVAAAQQRGRAHDLWETAKELLSELEAAKEYR